MAIATASLTFTAAGADSQAFTWTLTTNPPKILSCSVSVTGSGQGGPVPWTVGQPTNTGGTVAISAPTDCVVTIVGSD